MELTEYEEIIEFSYKEPKKSIQWNITCTPNNEIRRGITMRGRANKSTSHRSLGWKLSVPLVNKTWPEL